MSASGVELRPVGEEDWQLWRDLRHRVLTTDPDAFGSTLALEQAFTERDWRRRVARGRSFVAWSEGRPVGMGGVVPEEEPGTWSVVAMWVEPSARGQGIGRRVLEHLLASVPPEDDVMLSVADGNPARELYARLGFVATGEVAPMRPGSSATKSRMVRRGSRTRNVLPRPGSDSTRIEP